MNRSVIGGPYVLPTDVDLIPVAELDDEDRALLGGASDQFVVTRLLSRSTSSVIDRDAADLLARFRTPTTIVAAIIAQSRASASDPRQLFDEALPLLYDYICEQILVPAGSAEARPIRPLHRVGTRVDALTILGCVQVLEDSELYQVRTPGGDLAAVKIARPGREGHLQRTMDREAAFLRHLDGQYVPLLVRCGVWRDLPYLATEWIDGAPANTVAGELRESGRPSARRELVELCARLSHAYASLHQRHVVHGDVHERNVLIQTDGRVVLVDFGLARRVDGVAALDTAERGGIYPYFEPEYAQARLAGQSPPRASALGEQYAVGALLYSLVTGHAHLPPTLDANAALEQLAQAQTRPFVVTGAAAWPELEVVLARALQRDPKRRLGSMAELHAQLARIAAQLSQPRRSRDATPRQLRTQRELERALLAHVGRDSALYRSRLPEAPTSTVNSGAAGIAYALYRLSALREDADLLAQADVWATRGLREIRRRDAVYTPDGVISPKAVGAIALYHTVTGVHCVRALIAHAMNDMATARDGVTRFVAASRRGGDALDLTTGTAGIALGCALMLHAAPPEIPAIRDALVRLGDRTVAHLTASLAGSIGARGAPRPLGVAHGWAGFLYATLRWNLLRGRAPENLLLRQLHELAHLGEHRDRGMRWPWSRGLRRAKREPDYFASWCNGSAGFVHLWLTAHRATNDDQFGRLAEQAAWHAWEATDAPINDLCCGFAGRAYALLAVYRATNDRRWHERAWTLFERAAQSADVAAPGAHALYKGQLGIALLGAELLQPERARMPLFEDEGWLT